MTLIHVLDLGPTQNLHLLVSAFNFQYRSKRLISTQFYVGSEVRRYSLYIILNRKLIYKLHVTWYSKEFNACKGHSRKSWREWRWYQQKTHVNSYKRSTSKISHPPIKRIVGWLSLTLIETFASLYAMESPSSIAMATHAIIPSQATPWPIAGPARCIFIVEAGSEAKITISVGIFALTFANRLAATGGADTAATAPAAGPAGARHHDLCLCELVKLNL